MPDFAERTHRLPLEDLREDYRAGFLDELNCETNPIVQFETWFKASQATDSKEPNAMTLATVSAEGRPSARVVLLKEVSDSGFVFYTNYTSRKARELETNPLCALTFWWELLEKQVRVEGEIAMAQPVSAGGVGELDGADDFQHQGDVADPGTGAERGFDPREELA